MTLLNQIALGIGWAFLGAVALLLCGFALIAPWELRQRRKAAEWIATGPDALRKGMQVVGGNLSDPQVGNPSATRFEFVAKAVGDSAKIRDDGKGA